MAKMDLAISVGEARARFFEESGFPPDGGMSASFVAFWKLGPIPIGFPNSNARRRALQMHDLHHVATGYPPTWTGEAEISAWELATGCGEYAFAWTITLQGLAVGLFVSPIKAWRAWVRGRNTRSLYAEQFSESLLQKSVGELRRYLGLDRPVPRAKLGDALSFGFWSAVALAQTAAMFALLALPVAGLGLLVRALV